MKNDWISVRSLSETLEILGTLSEACVCGPISRDIFTYVKAKDWLAVTSYSFDPYYHVGDQSVNDLVAARQIQAFYSKLDCLPVVGVDKRKAAIRRFIESEDMCRDTNKRLKLAARGLPDSELNAILYSAQTKIANVLGSVPPLDELNLSFGPGANTNVLGTRANPRTKMSVVLECSHELAPTVAHLLSEMPSWTAIHSADLNDEFWLTNVDVVPGRVSFVPKNYSTDRSIMIEPILNSVLQRGIGRYMKERLLKFGCNLYDQTRNQQLARSGSIDGLLATIDLSMASDCLSIELVYSLLPLDWAEFLYSARTGQASFEGEIINLEKFSSMGNGFTFELESLIFYSLALSVADYLNQDVGLVSVYGDDIIIQSLAVPLLSRVLRFCGFVVNRQKSYCEGYFRESCGSDYYKGINIRPFYQKSLISDRNLYTMHNFFIRNCEFDLASLVKTFCKPSLVIYGPDGFGDGHLIGSHQLRLGRTERRKGWCGGYFDTYSLRSRSVKGAMRGDYALPAYSVYVRSGEEGPTDPYITRGSVGYHRISIYTLSTTVFRRGT